MSYFHKPHVQPLDFRAPFQLLKAHATAHPNKEALVFRDLTDHRVTITFHEYDTRSQAVAAGLLEFGVRRGDRVLLLMTSCPEFAVCQLALNRIGALAIISEADCIPAINGINKLACVISKSDYSSNDGQQTVAEIHSMIKEQEKTKAILIGYEGDALQHDQIISYKDLVDMATKNPHSLDNLQSAESMVTLDDPCVILFTSGSTGVPKPIQISNHELVNGCIKDALSMLVTKETRIFNDSPFDWSPGFAFGIGYVITQGCTLVAFPPKVGFKGGCTSKIAEVMAQEECSHCWVLPYFLHDLALKGIPDSIDLTKLKYWTTGGQPLSISITRKLLDMLPDANIINLYGSTETCSLATQIVTRDNINTIEHGALDFCPGYEMKAIDSHGQIVPIGTKGELCVRAAWVCFPNPDILTNPPPIKKTSNNWHHLSDSCSFNAQGQIRLYGRIDFLIKCATESIQPTEIEVVLDEHPDVDKVCVCSVPDQRLYHKICACIVMKQEAQGDQESFDKWSSERFCEFSIGLSYKPHYYVFMERFPLTRSGKLCRRQTRELAIKQLGL